MVNRKVFALQSYSAIRTALSSPHVFCSKSVFHSIFIHKTAVMLLMHSTSHIHLRGNLLVLADGNAMAAGVAKSGVEKFAN